MNSRRLLLLAAASGGAALLAGCSPTTAVSTPSGHSANAVLAVAPDVSVSPSDHAADVPLDAPVTVSSNTGSLTSVTVRQTKSGAVVPGQLSPDGKSWTATDGLDPAAQYQVMALATGPGGTHTTTASTFTTLLKVGGRLTTTVSPLDGTTVGVGEPIDLRFSTDIPIANRTEIVQRLHVVSTPSQVGGWHWFDGYTLHYRPAQYWQTGTKVTVTADFHGVNAGNGVWGLGDWVSSFTVGQKHVSLINDTTHTMQVYTNDQLVDTWPVSLGKPGFRTLEGTLVVLYKTPKVMMDSCHTFGGAACIPGSTNYYHDYVYDDTAISTNGFFIHAAPWSEPSQGFTDVSHGCVNLSTAHAVIFFNYSLPGDVVVISNTGNPADITNGEEDWQIPFAQWDNTGVTQASATTTAPSASAAPGGP